MQNSSSYVQRFMNYRVDREKRNKEKKLSDDAQHNTVVATADSKLQTKSHYTVGHKQEI